MRSVGEADGGERCPQIRQKRTVPMLPSASMYILDYLCHNLEWLIIDLPRVGYHVMMLYRRPSLSRPSVILKSLKMSVLRMLGHL